MRVLDLIYPPACPLCGKTVERSRKSFPLCGACEAIAETLRFGKQQAYQTSVLPENAGFCCAFRYAGAIREAVVKYKYNGEIWMAEPFAELLHRQFLAGGYALFEVMTYVPVSGRSRAARGYDQTLEIIKKLQDKNKIAYTESFIKKDTAGDNALGRKNRIERSQVNRYTYAGNETDIRRKSVLLLYDILTTGSTIRECTRLLLAHGAGCVFAGVLASGRRDI